MKTLMLAAGKGISPFPPTRERPEAARLGVKVKVHNSPSYPWALEFESCTKEL